MSINKLYLEPDGLQVGVNQLVASGGGVSVGKNLLVFGNTYVGSSNANVFASYGRVGIGTSTVTNSNILSVFGNTDLYGNIKLVSTTSGIYFADGTYQSTAAASSTPYSNTNVASYLSGPVQVGNLTINNTTASTSTLTGALLMGGGAGIQGAAHIGGLIYGGSTLNIAGAAQVNSLISNGAVSGTTGTFTGALYGASFNTAGTATVNSLVSNGAVSGTTGTFTGALYGSSFNTAGTATVNALVSNGAVSGTTGTFTGALYGASFNTAGTATVNALVSNGAISGTTINGTSATVTSLQNSGTETVNALVANIFGRFGQNVTVNSTNTSTSTTTGALIVGGGIGAGGNLNVGGTRSSFTGFVSVGAAVVPNFALDVTGEIAIRGGETADDARIYFQASDNSNRFTIETDLDTSTTNDLLGFRSATVDDILVLKGDGKIGITTNVPGSTLDVNGIASFRSAISVAGTATVNALVSNGAISGTTITGTAGTFTSIQASSTATVNTLISNVYGLFGQNVTVNSTNASTTTTTGALILAGGAGIGGNINVGGANNLFTNRVGIGTSAVLGARANVLAVYGTTEIYGNIDLGNPTGGTSGIYFADGTYQVTAAVTTPYSNTNVASYLSGPVQVGNLTINNTTASTSTLTGALLMGGGAGIQGAVHIGGLIYGGSTLNIAGAAQVNSLISNGAISGTTINGTSATVTSLQNSGTETVNALISNVYGRFGQNVTVNSTNTSTSTTTGALIVGGGVGIAGAVHAGGLIYGASTLNIAGAAQVNSLISNGAVSGTTGTFTGALYGASFNTAGTATVNALVSNGAVSGTTGTFTGALYGGSFNTAGTATVNALVSNGAVSGTTGTFTGALYGGSFNTAGTATVNALVSNGAISGTTINGTSATVTSLQNSGTTTTNALISNVYGRFGQNVTVNSTNTSTSTTTGALIVGGGAGVAGAVHAGGLIYGASTLNIAGAAQVNSLISNGAVSGTTGTFTSALYGASFNTAGTATVNALVSNGAVSGTTGTFTGALYGGSFNTAGTATVNALVSNGAVSGTTGTFTGALYGGSFNTAGTATVNALVSNGAISGTTITGTSATVTSLQNSGLVRSANIVSNTWIHATQNLTVASSNTSISTTTGALVVSGGVGVAGNVNAGGTRSLFTGAIGVGTTTAAGIITGTGVGNDMYVWGNVRIANTSTTSSGIVFADGTIQNTAATGSGSGTSFGAAGTIQFAGAANTFTGDTANFFWDDTNNRLGLGASTTPASTLDVRGGVGVTGASNFGSSLTVSSLVSNGAVSGTTGTFTGALYGGSFNTAGTATVNTLISNVYGLFGQNVTVNSTNASTTTTTGALLLAGGAGISGNINVGGANNLFTNRVGIGTSTVLGARSNVLSVYGTAEIYGNIDLANPTGGTSGIYFADGTYQTTASGVGIIRQTFTATANQTTFTVSYTPGAIDVYQNGSKLNVGTDVTATNGTSIVLAIAADAGDTIETLTNSLFNVANAVPLTGGTISGQLNLSANIPTTSTTTGTLVVTGGIGLSGNIHAGGQLSYFGNTIGIGFVPTGWVTDSTSTIEIKAPDSGGGTASLTTIGMDADLVLSRNAYYGPSGWQYRSDGVATFYGQSSGATHIWFAGLGGVADSAVSFVPLMQLDYESNLSIGTSSVFYATGGRSTLSLNGSSQSLIALGAADAQKGYLYTDGTSIVLGADAGSMALSVSTANPITFNTNSLERMRIASNGNVGIGTNTPRDTLQVFNGNISVGIDTANVTVITPSYITLSTQGNVPVAPPTGEIQVFSKNVGTRNMLSQQGPSGIDTSIQPLIGRNRVYYWSAAGLNTTTAPVTSLGATAFTTVGTATARAFATTNIRTRMTRMAYVSTTTAGTLASLRVATAWLTTGTGTGLGGFFYLCRFGVSDASAVAGARMFVGLSSNTGAATNVDPATQLNQLGIAQISTDNTQWYFVYGGSAAQAAIALGTTLGAPTLTTTSWDLALFSPPGSNGDIGYTVTNIGTGVSVTGRITPGTPGTQTPANTTALTPQIWRTNNATALAVAIDFMSLYIETDD